jgi:hypothetical protein
MQSMNCSDFNDKCESIFFITKNGSHLRSHSMDLNLLLALTTSQE